MSASMKLDEDVFEWGSHREMIERTIDIFFRFGTEGTVGSRIWELEFAITPEVI